MTREEEIKLKIEYQLYKNNNGLQMADDDEVALRLFKDIKDIRSEIAWHKDDKIIHLERNEMVDTALEIIDRHISGKESEEKE